jgi:hypothetical protein
VTRAGQRVLFDFAAAHRGFCDTLAELTVGDGADDDARDAERTAAAIDEDAFVDTAHEMQRVRAAQVCDKRTRVVAVALVAVPVALSPLRPLCVWMFSL